MKTVLLTLLILLCSLISAQTAREISLKAMNAVEIGDMEMISTIIIADARGNERIRQISTASRQFGDCTKMLTVFLQPADVKGTSLLVYDYESKEDNMWIFMPALRKVRRIVSTEKGKNFMGSEFSNADMSKPNIDDFSYADLGFETVDGIKSRKIESKPKNNDIAKENNFSRKISFFDATTNLCYRIEYYDMADKLHRIQTISNNKKLPGGKYFAHQMVMVNVQNGRKTTMKVDRFQQGSNLPESRFSPNALEQ
jgi:hypothetical protein